MIAGRAGGRRRRVGLAALGAAAALVLGLAAPPAASASGSRGDDRLTVMTRNLYLGSSLTPALTATDTPAFLGAVARIYGTALFTSFPTRAGAIADEVAASRPDLVGLQEVSRWVTSGPGVPPTLDFLTELQSALAARGLHYTVASVAENANIGPVPLVTPCGSTVVGACLVTLQDRDVILVNADRKGLTWSSARSGRYVAQQSFQPPVPGAAPVSFSRGWTTIEGRLHGVRFHFANTHLETEDFPAVQEAQAAEFLAGPALGRGADIATGDFNSAADGSTTTSYAQLTKRFRDAWRVNRGAPGLTCCQNETLTNPVSQLRSRIDLVLARSGARAVSAKVVGATPFQAAPPFWASDHAGVVAVIELDD
ncbi:endonuclease/exonuclease/phosphatase family protein [Kineosporia sp. R_H_3]|uniref:endonuclease/exonuclease/phosphatase family protein n=1 Tax=Kineosporia sp. R_H_3 TaxID=1961848 RepID=UPI0011799889|nr:endonuclease/exonuclease/phosphatase family protein [Kineosporia sp. R_H_3]